MQNYCKTIGALAAASALVAGNAKADVQYELHTGYSSEYVFRGLDSGDGLVEVGLDAKMDWNGLSLSAGVWDAYFQDTPGVTSVNPLNPHEDYLNETDFYGQVSKDLGFLTASVGYIYYWEHGPLGTDNQEVYFQISRDFGFAAASLTYYWSVGGNNNNGYSELALTRSFDLSPCLKLNLASTLGYLIEEGQCSAWTNKASLDWGFAEHVKLSPFIAWSISCSDIRNTVYQGASNQLTAGSMLSVDF